MGRSCFLTIEYTEYEVTLADYEYNEYNGKLNKITYGNGFVVEYVCDDLDNLSEAWYTVNGVERHLHSITCIDTEAITTMQTLGCIT
ncbi:MAG: hypothetical protein J6Q85_00245 [Clostridia bacterium]|nr:hypothetical protein [Clostridia bacterium]